MLTSQDDHGDLSTVYASAMGKFFGDDEFKHKLVKLLGELVHDDVNRVG